MGKPRQPVEMPDQAGVLFTLLLDQKIAARVAEMELTEVWKAVVSPVTDPRFLRVIMREVYLEIHSSQSTLRPAALALLARLPKNEPKLTRILLQYLLNHSNDGAVTLKDYLALGGDEIFALTRRRSLEALVFDGMWWELFRRESPYCYFGALYPFEGIASIFFGKLHRLLDRRGLPTDTLGFTIFRAREDSARQSLVRPLIKELVIRHPEVAADIEYGLDCFLRMYPIPIWTAAYERAKAEFKPPIFLRFPETWPRHEHRHNIAGTLVG